MYLSTSSRLLALVALLGTNARAQWSILDHYSPNNFLDMFKFSNATDLSHGFVRYLDYPSARQQGLVRSGDTVYLGVDNTSVIQPGGPGRSSVRLESKKTYTHGLFIADIAHMPGGACGIWPAFWTTGPNWPNGGEIDIIEQVNLATTNLVTLHTSQGCVMGQGNSTSTGQMGNANCFYQANNGQGCAFTDTDSRSFGPGFNAAGGGVYAMEWTSKRIAIWFFSRASIPSNVLSNSPDPSTWGPPLADYKGSCDIDARFQDHQIVFNTDFCGDWAGNVWQTSGCANSSTTGGAATTCSGYVAAHPEAFSAAYWEINSLKVFQESNSTANSTIRSNPAYPNSTLASNTTLSSSAPGQPKLDDLAAIGPSPMNKSTDQFVHIQSPNNIIKTKHNTTAAVNAAPSNSGPSSPNDKLLSVNGPNGIASNPIVIPGNSSANASSSANATGSQYLNITRPNNIIHTKPKGAGGSNQANPANIVPGASGQKNPGSQNLPNNNVRPNVVNPVRPKPSNVVPGNPATRRPVPANTIPAGSRPPNAPQQNAPKPNVKPNVVNPVRPRPSNVIPGNSASRRPVPANTIPGASGPKNAGPGAMPNPGARPNPANPARPGSSNAIPGGAGTPKGVPGNKVPGTSGPQKAAPGAPANNNARPNNVNPMKPGSGNSAPGSAGSPKINPGSPGAGTSGPKNAGTGNLANNNNNPRPNPANTKNPVLNNAPQQKPASSGVKAPSPAGSKPAAVKALQQKPSAPGVQAPAPAGNRPVSNAPQRGPVSPAVIAPVLVQGIKPGPSSQPLRVNTPNSNNIQLYYVQLD